MTTGRDPTCPLFVFSVYKISPAARGGIKPGDRLLSVDGQTVTTLESAAQRMRSTSASPVTLQLMRDARPYTVTIQRIDYPTLLQQNGKKILKDGSLLDLRATDADVAQFVAVNQALQNAKDLSVAFPQHYPANKQLYYPGFEAFVWDGGNQVTVGGIEDGPASRAGVRWGDQIVAVDGVDPHRESVADLESMLSSVTPKSMTLVIERAGTRRKFSFELVQATTVLRDNNRKVANGKLVPIWAPDKYLPCFQ